MTTAELRTHIRDPFLRRLLDAPEPTPETPEEAAARRADLAARLDADIAETERHCQRCGCEYEEGIEVHECPPGFTYGTIDVPQCMLDAFGLTQETT